MKRLMAGLILALGLTCATFPLQAQQVGGAFIPSFSYIISGVYTWTQASPFVFEGATDDDSETTLTVTDPTADRTLTLPNATDTLVGKATTDTLTNKTLTAPVVTRPTVINLVPTTVVLSVADSAKVSVQTLATGTQTYTLPTAASAPGAVFTFVCQHASSEILINPNVADQVSIKGLVDHSTSVKPVAGTGVKNTAATNVIGDHLTLVSDGVNTWYEVAGAGIWASQ